MVATTMPSPPGEDREQRHAKELSRLVQHLRRPGLRERTGVLQVQSHRLLDLGETAARLDMNLVDYGAVVAAEIPEGATTLVSTPDHEIKRLQRIGEEHRASSITLVTNVDEMLSRWADNAEYRRIFWYAFEHKVIKTATALALALPMTRALVPDDETVARLTASHRWAILPQNLPEMRNRAA
jgi:non-ribosomal peptide synthetase component F